MSKKESFSDHSTFQMIGGIDPTVQFLIKLVKFLSDRVFVFLTLEFISIIYLSKGIVICLRSLSFFPEKD